jgi:predicted  nucleic acid-binding Zn-ribbon protein
MPTDKNLQGVTEQRLNNISTLKKDIARLEGKCDSARKRLEMIKKGQAEIRAVSRDKQNVAESFDEAIKDITCYIQDYEAQIQRKLAQLKGLQE